MREIEPHDEQLGVDQRTIHDEVALRVRIYRTLVTIGGTKFEKPLLGERSALNALKHATDSDNS